MKKYKNIETWTRAMQKDKSHKLWNDWHNIGGHWYTCEEFDNGGKYMRFTSVTAWQHIDIETSNRYSPLWLSDMKTTVYPIESLRFDITYYIDSDITDRQLIELSQREELEKKDLKNLILFALTK